MTCLVGMMMMRRIVRPCVVCSVLTKSARCAKCQRELNKSRPSASQRGYDAKWRKLSKYLREAQPWCTWCGTTVDLTVDHVLPLSMGGSNELENLRVLCRPCNSARKQQLAGF